MCPKKGFGSVKSVIMLDGGGSRWRGSPDHLIAKVTAPSESLTNSGIGMSPQCLLPPIRAQILGGGEGRRISPARVQLAPRCKVTHRNWCQVDARTEWQRQGPPCTSRRMRPRIPGIRRVSGHLLPRIRPSAQSREGPDHRLQRSEPRYSLATARNNHVPAGPCSATSARLAKAPGMAAIFRILPRQGLYRSPTVSVWLLACATPVSWPSLRAWHRAV
jgi:hypothetical protein